ncbi:helicase-related protein [Sphingomonas floccifaciens]|uniref:Transcription-repair-coupling factor n=1 Tax=Sphingomonas floccifaciens TaxID=1844115 RepID=A0ABW4NIE5_9SPHN
MLQPPPSSASTTIVPPAAAVAIQLIEADAPKGIVFVARDHSRADAVAALVRAFAPDRLLVHYPASDALPGEAAGASAANIGLRVSALHALHIRDVAAGAILILPVAATLERVASAEAFDAEPPLLTIGQTIDGEAFRALLEEIGYRDDDRVDEPGEYAVRGRVVDVYPVDAAGPARITLDDEGRIAGIDWYDALTQRSTAACERLAIGRAAEPTAERNATLLDHLPGAAVMLDTGVEDRRARLATLAAETLRAKAATVDAKDWDAALSARPSIALTAADTTPPPRFVERKDPTAAFARFAKAALAEGPLVIVGVERDLRFLKPRLARRLKTEIVDAADWSVVQTAKAGTVLALTAVLPRGLVAGNVTIVAAADLLGGRAGRDDGGADGLAALSMGEVAIGDVVVHERYGIGRVLGLESLTDGDEGIVLDYARGGRRVVALAEADMLWRYGADGDAVALDSLDGSSWDKRRAEIDRAVAESARALAKVAEERAARTTVPVVPDAGAYEKFAAAFPFTETPDQARAIAAIRDDLASGKPMDRLIVGDVGYGKTEVALRAAAMVALAGRQVVVAAPTTVLVRQHLDTFRKRFEGTGIEVASLSRLSSTAEAKRVKAGLADGSIRIVVGTAAVAGKGVTFADLALVAIDEEQRFGAAQKAKLSGLGAGHSLLLSATPIPRTLQSALIGLQDVSVIATPPARRQPIRTVVSEFDDATVRAALLREEARGGQSFVVVPRIEDIAPLEAKLRKLVPELGLVVAHGKLPAAEIDEAMTGFANGDGSVLLATNIIEAGLDVPRANTMIVHRADRFGLAQLHQLRGRVGRGGRRGQILLTTESGKTIADRTVKRLQTLQAFDRLGAGFAISAQDLDMRGAGDLLGEEQAGHMKLIGVDLYQHLLTGALRAARGESAETPLPDLSLGQAGHLPDDWIPEASVRLALYMRLVRITEPSELDRFEEELEDRFGPLPAPAARLIEWMRIRLLAHATGVAAITAGPAAIAFTPTDRKADWAAAGLTEKAGRWIDATAIADDDARLERVREVLEALAEG